MSGESDHPNSRAPDGQLEFTWTGSLQRGGSGMPTSTRTRRTRSPRASVLLTKRAARETSLPVSSALDVAASDTGYEPGHPWHYLRGGRPMPVHEISGRASEGRYVEHELPKSPARRLPKIQQLLEHDRRHLEDSRRTYQNLVEHGAKALRSYDKYEVSVGDEELEIATSLSLAFNHIRFFCGRVEYLEQELKKCNLRGRTR